MLEGEGSWVAYTDWHPEGDRIMALVMEVGANGSKVVEATFGPALVKESEARVLFQGTGSRRLYPMDWDAAGQRVSGQLEREGTRYAAVLHEDDGSLTELGECVGIGDWIPGRNAFLAVHENVLLTIDAATGERTVLRDMAKFDPGFGIQGFFSITDDGSQIYLPLMQEEKDV